ncbi:hypothetical protein LDVICp176 [lymphocystis disease virus-China]|uniref:FAM111A-like protein n=2 Tax=Lymphocystis disease virus 2 TaxID=159183 RepID=A0A6F8X2M8_9VIRU|nr:hypothetical protein LDVICp176 [lymphocystis disease virus-China]AAU11020.1 hypothetical protein [lymphocystis disease virus-China]BCB67516.1 FAM111A-like protein [Lymphocystis disease virus 2]
MKINNMTAKYCIFYISTATSKRLFVKDAVLKQFKTICVYGEKDVTIDLAIKNDGRFIDFGDYKLRDVNSLTIFDKTACIQNVNDKLLEIVFSKLNDFKLQDVDTLEIFNSDVCVEQVVDRKLKIIFVDNVHIEEQ